MRLVEWLLVVAEMSATVSVWMLYGGTPSWLTWLIAASIFLLFVHALIEGVHWQLGPAYLACCFLVLYLTPIGHGRVAVLALPITVAILILTSLVFSWALPMFQLPEPSGDYPVGTRIFFMTDTRRRETHDEAIQGDRQIVVQLWYPAADSKGRRACYRRLKETTRLSSYQAVLRTNSIENAALPNGRFPVLVFNHAWGDFRNRCTYSFQDLASHGFIVVSISHTYNSGVVALADGRVVHHNQFDVGFDCPDHIPLEDRLALADEELRIQTDDCRFVLDSLEEFDRTPGHLLEKHIDTGKVGTYGYSFGGAVSVEFAKEDPRVGAALQLDGVLHGNGALEGLNKPFMAIDSSVMKRHESPSGAVDSLGATAIMMKRSADAKVATLVRFGGYRVCIGDMNHGSFSDKIFMSPLGGLSGRTGIPPVRCAEILNGYALAFFQQSLLKRPSPLLSEEAKSFPEAELRIFPSPRNTECEPDAVGSRA
jgi:dienelactone hydrolase